jgi:DNA-directed RNA polymerase specialized sigma24 family protein
MRSLMLKICRLLPSLRLYAQTYTGSRERGDAYVRVCLEMVIEDPERLRPDEDLRLELYRLLHVVFARIGMPETPKEKLAFLPLREDDDVDDLGDSRHRIQQAILTLPPLKREIVLLSSLEDFDVDTIASIVGLSRLTVVQQLNNARHDIYRTVEQAEAVSHRMQMAAG